MGGYVRTFILLAALSAIFGAVGYAIGGGGGAFDKRANSYFACGT
jgi:hypothetical protein